MAVDTHIFRVSNRTRLSTRQGRSGSGTKLLKVIPAEFMLHAHHWLILHGRYTCIARKPKCGQCPVYDVCGFRNKSDFVE